MAAVTNIALGKLSPDPHQPRKSFGDSGLKALAENIKARGIQQPLLVRREGTKLVIKDGERRWRAAKLAKLKTVPVIEVKDGDAVQTRLDQVAVNNLREPLKPMDLARLVVQLRDEHKLSANQIAARLEKDGIPYAGRKALENTLRLVELPDWAQALIDEDQAAPAAMLPLLVAKDEPKVLAAASKAVRQRSRWSGRVEQREVEQALRDAYRDTGPDLTRVQDWIENPVRFDPKTACKGCEHLRAVGAAWFCRNKAHYDELQAQAKEAGLLAGGKKPPKKTTKPVAGAEPGDGAEGEAQPERGAQGRMRRLREYFDAWLRREIEDFFFTVELQEKLSFFLAAGMPHGPRYGGGLHMNSGLGGHVHGLAAASLGRKRLTDFLDRAPTAGDRTVLARAALAMLTQREVVELANWLKLDLPARYRIDAAYLNLKRKAELLAIAKIGGLELPATTGAADIRGLILGDGSTMERKGYTQERVAGVVERIGVPPEISAIYTEPDPVLDHLDDAGVNSAGDLKCAACGCTEEWGCDDGCEWIRTDLDAGLGLCSNCEEFTAAWDAGVRQGLTGGEPVAEAAA